MPRPLSRRELMVYARLAIYERALNGFIEEARAACQPRAKRQGRRLEWWRGQLQGLVAASAILAPVKYPEFNPQEEATAKVLAQSVRDSL